MQTVTGSPFALPVRDYSPTMRIQRNFAFTAFYRCHATPRASGLWSMTKLLLMAQLWQSNVCCLRVALLHRDFAPITEWVSYIQSII